MQDSQAIHDVVDFAGEIFTSPDGSVTTARPSQQGFYAAAAAVPSWLTLIGVAPANGPVGDTVKFTIPADAKPGTYSVVMKARRSYLGEELPRATTIHVQVGTTTHTQKTYSTGNCQSCHNGGSDLTRISHGISINDRDTCTTCHGPLPFEPEGPVYVRSHFIHSRTDRLSAPLTECKTCHLNQQGIQRTSKSACMSCHKSYPDSHVQQFGPVVDMYIGGTLADSFQQCSTTCHQNHPQSGLLTTWHPSLFTTLAPNPPTRTPPPRRWPSSSAAPPPGSCSPSSPATAITPPITVRSASDCRPAPASSAVRPPPA
jgi:hypothetical protein